MNEVDVANPGEAPAGRRAGCEATGGLLRQAQVHPAAKRAGPAGGSAGHDQGRSHQGQHRGKVRQGDPEPGKLLKSLSRATDKVEELYKSGKRKNKRITEGVLKGKQTPMKVVNDVAAHLHTNTLKDSELLLNFLHAMQHGMDAESIWKPWPAAGLLRRRR